MSHYPEGQIFVEELLFVGEIQIHCQGVSRKTLQLNSFYQANRTVAQTPLWLFQASPVIDKKPHKLNNRIFPISQHLAHVSENLSQFNDMLIGQERSICIYLMTGLFS